MDELTVTLLGLAKAAAWVIPCLLLTLHLERRMRAGRRHG